ncbi:MAG: cardiolipin synthase, partial [Erysipelotrichaceae bacterium]|nr:cardiolipin synthase [Erysipelotrichaceae bacterium]
ADNPLDTEKVGQKVYMDILNRAVNYVHIMTPYLILDYELENALKFAAQRGVDVSIIVPGIPDKKSAYALMKTHYASLLEAGVHLYEYTPGFVHAKVFVSDDIKAVVGTINLDYRSLVHHFECAAYLYQTECIDEIEKDFRHTLLQCAAVDESVLKKVSPVTKIMGFVLKVLAPLM